ncbi:MAG: AMP-binding protein [Nitrospirae bacterium]|nr:AMP-binding protein [Nitrospirota bacterium]
MTLVKMLERNARLTPDKAAIFFHSDRISYSELDSTANRVANALIEAGVVRGDRIGLMLPRVPELIAAFLGIAKANAVAVPINFDLLESGVRAAMSQTSPKCVIVHKHYLELARQALPPAAKALIIAVDGDGRVDELSWTEVLRNYSSAGPSLEINDEDVVYLNYTSGSSGNPKCAITTHSNIYWNTYAASDALELTSEDIHICMFAPQAHPHELLARPLYLGGSMVLLETIFPKSLAEAIASHGVTCMMGIAPMYEKLLETVEDRHYDLSSLKIAESGGMHTNTDLIDRFRKKIGVPVLPVWGSTETTGIAIANRPGEEIVRDSIGRPCPGYEVKLVDEENREVDTGETGEMIFRSPAVVKGYFEDRENTNNCFRGGWYYSGDLAKMDDCGNLFFVDRKSGMMKVTGLKVYPMEIERVLMEHPDIREVAVISSTDRLRGEVPKAIIVPANGKVLSTKEVVDFCREKLPNYKLPRIVEFRECLPKTGSGKCNKKELHMEELSKR